MQRLSITLIRSIYLVVPWQFSKGVSIQAWLIMSSGGAENVADDEEHYPLLASVKLTRPLPSIRTVSQTLKSVNWRNVFSVIVAVFDYFLVYCAISLIGTFFPTEVCFVCGDHYQIVSN